MPLIETDIHNELTALINRSLDVGELFLEPLDVADATRRIKSEVRDAPERFWINDSQKERRYILALSPEAFPGAVASWVKPAREIGDSLEQGLRQGVCLPVLEGICSGRSYAVWRFYRGWADSKPKFLLELALSARKIRAWLFGLGRNTRRPVTESSEIERIYAYPLEFLTQQKVLSNSIRRAANRALARIDSRECCLSTVAQHGDFWFGNILHTNSPLFGSSELRIIDWGAAGMIGYPYYDLVKLVSSSSLLEAAFGRKWIAGYSEYVGVKSEDGLLYLLSGLGSLGMNRAEFPFERYILLVERQYSVFKRLC